MTLQRTLLLAGSGYILYATKPAESGFRTFLDSWLRERLMAESGGESGSGLLHAFRSVYSSTVSATFGLMTDVQFQDAGIARVATVSIPEVGVLHFVGIASNWYCVETMAAQLRASLVDMGVLQEEN